MSKSNFKIEEVKSLPDSEVQITGDITLDFLLLCRKEAIGHLNSHLNLPGFRKGNIPENVLLKTVGEMGVLEETAEIAIAKEYGKIIDESKLKPITRPEIKITKLAPGIPLSFQINIVIEPEFEIPDYKNILVDASEEDIEKRRMRMIENIIKEAKINLPKKFIDAEAIHMLHHFKADVEKAGIKWNEYLEKVKKTDEEISESFKEQIASRTKAELVLSKIAEKENLKTYADVFEFLERVK